MAENRIYAYCRVSKNDGTMTIENQVHAIEQWAKAKNIVISAFYKDECKGDTPIEKRSQLPVMLENLRDGDTVIVTEIFRLYRSFTGLEKIYRYIVETKKAEFITLNDKEQILCTANTDKNDVIQMSMKSMCLVFFSLFSELEKKNLSLRTKRALKQRKDSGKQLGRPIVTELDKNKETLFRELFEKAVSGTITHTKAMDELGLKKTSYYKIAKNLGLVTNKKIVGK